MPEQDETSFPRNMYHETYGVISADCQETMDLALSRGFKRVPPALNSIPKLKSKIAEVEAELKELKENLAAKEHETEIAMKAAEILEKMQAEAAAKEVEATKVAEEQAAKEAKEAEEKAAAEATTKAKAEVDVKSIATPTEPTVEEPKKPEPPPTTKVVEFGEKGKKK